MGNTNEASKADLNKGIIGVFRLCHFDRMLLHGCRLLSSVPCGVPHFMGALYRFKSAKSTAKTAKFRSRFLPHFRQQHQSLSYVLYRASDSKRRGGHWSLPSSILRRILQGPMPSSARFSSWHCTNVILNIEMCKTRRNSKIVTQRSGHHFERSCERYAARSDEVGEIRLHFGFAKITNRAVVDSPSTLARRWTRRRSRRDSFAFLPLAKISEAASVCTGGRHSPPDCADF